MKYAMIDKIVELDNNKKYVILDGKKLNNINYYFALRLDNKEEPTNNYLFFQEKKLDSDIYLLPISDEKLKDALLTTFTINYLDKVYDME